MHLLYGIQPKKFQQALNASISDSTISCFLVQSRMEVADVRHSLSSCLFLATVRYHRKQANELIKPGKYSVVLMFNGRMMPYRVFLNRVNQIADSTRVLCHERGFESSSFVIKSGEPAHKRAVFSSILKQAFNSSLKLPISAVSTWADSFYTKRVIGENTDCILPNYVPGNVSPIYTYSEFLIVFYLTTPDEIDPSSPEFLLIENQWKLLPRVCELIRNSSYPLNNARIVFRLHPNFFSRASATLFHLNEKIGRLKHELAKYQNVFIDSKPQESSPFDIFKLSDLSVSFASSAALESEYFGTPALVPQDHIYSCATSYSYDFKKLLDSDWRLIASQGFSMTPNLAYSSQRHKLLVFSFLWFYLDKYRFSTIKNANFFGINVLDNDEISPDYLFLCNNYHLTPSQFTLNKILSSTQNYHG